MPIKTDIEFADELRKYKVGETVNLNIIRDKRFIQVDNVTLKVFPVPTDKLYGQGLTIPIPKN